MLADKHCRVCNGTYIYVGIKMNQEYLLDKYNRLMAIVRVVNDLDSNDGWYDHLLDTMDGLVQKMDYDTYLKSQGKVK